MKYVSFIILVIVIGCVFNSYLPFLKSIGKNSDVAGKENLAISDEKFAGKRKSMVKQQIIARGIKNKIVLDAMENVPRHMFVPEVFREYSYYDQPLPIGLNQTISQPYIVALMTEMLDVDKNDVVLEIGTGSGYQAAILSKIVKEVYTIEIIRELGVQAKEKLGDLGYDNVNVKIGDGSLGWPERAPFDGIIVTAAAEKIPEHLIKQLKQGAKMVVPVNSSSLGQDLLIVEKDENGKINIKKTIPVRFVPLVEGEKTAK